MRKPGAPLRIILTKVFQVSPDAWERSFKTVDIPATPELTRLQDEGWSVNYVEDLGEHLPKEQP